MNALALHDRYNTGAIVLHWTIAALVLFNLIVGLFHESLLKGLPLMPAHKAIGIIVLVLTLARIAWRLMHRPPALPADIRGWERGAAHGVHWALYALMLLLPISGWVMSSNPARPRPIDFFGLFEIPVLPASGAMAGGAHEAHEILGLMMAALVVLHIAAALRHHFLLKDNVLRRMMPHG